MKKNILNSASRYIKAGAIALSLVTAFSAYALMPAGPAPIDIIKNVICDLEELCKNFRGDAGQRETSFHAIAQQLTQLNQNFKHQLRTIPAIKNSSTDFEKNSNNILEKMHADLTMMETQFEQAGNNRSSFAKFSGILNKSVSAMTKNLESVIKQLEQLNTECPDACKSQFNQALSTAKRIQAANGKMSMFATIVRVKALQK